MKKNDAHLSLECTLNAWVEDPENGMVGWSIGGDVPPYSPGDTEVVEEDETTETRFTLLEPGLGSFTTISKKTGRILKASVKEVALDFGAIYFK